MKWGIVGGGVTGLTLALRLRSQGHEVTLLESAPLLGGLARPWEAGNITWDRFYHVILLSDNYTRGILRDIGVERDLQWVETRTGLYADGHLTSLSNAAEYLRLPVLNLLERLRLGLTILYASKVRNREKLEKIPVEQWLTQLSGKGTFQKLWRPLLRAKLGEGWRKTSAAFIWATTQRLYAARRTGLKKEMFGYLPGGYAAIFREFEDHLLNMGVTIQVGRNVDLVKKHGNRFIIQSAGEKQEFDRVALTCSNSRIAGLCPQLAPDEQTLLTNTIYQGLVCASVLLEKPLADYYLTYLMDDELPFTAVVEMTAFIDPQQLGGKTLVYLPRYIDADDPFFRASDEEVRRSFLAGLEKIYPAFRREDVLAFQVAREGEIFPVPVLEYSKKIPPIRSSIPGLYFVTSAQIVNGTLNVNDSIRIAETALPVLLADVADHPARGMRQE
ncbi:FAD-dependent oxidoreductase [Thermodesulfobacteriota bacterium B35]